MYQYLPIDQAQPGDIVQATITSETAYTKDNLYIIKTLGKTNNKVTRISTIEDNTGSVNGMLIDNFKLVATKPGNQAKIGDTVFCIKSTNGDCKHGDSFIVDNIPGDYLGPVAGTKFKWGLSQPGWSWKNEYFKVLCKSTEQPTIRRNLAFYKRSEQPWTQKEYNNILIYTEGVICSRADAIIFSGGDKFTYIFDCGKNSNFQFMWGKQQEDTNFYNCKQVAYEDIFPNQRVAVVIQQTDTGFPLGSRIIQENPTLEESTLQYWLLVDDLTHPAIAYSLPKHCVWEDMLTTGIIHYSNPCAETAQDDFFDSTRYKEDPAFLASLDYTEKINQTKKDSTMNELQQLLSTIFGADKPTTDYDKRPAILVVVYSLDGKKVATATAVSIEQVTAEVKRNPALWGCKVLTYKLSKELFVDIPVAITKAQVASESEVE